MEIIAWSAGRPLGRDAALRLVDPRLVERLHRSRSHVGGIPAFLEEAQKHCSRQMITRSHEREVRSVEERPMARSPGFERLRLEPLPAPPRFEVLVTEVAGLQHASPAAYRGWRATRAVLRVLLSQKKPPAPERK